MGCTNVTVTTTTTKKSPERPLSIFAFLKQRLGETREPSARDEALQAGPRPPSPFPSPDGPAAASRLSQPGRSPPYSRGWPAPRPPCWPPAGPAPAALPCPAQPSAPASSAPHPRKKGWKNPTVPEPAGSHVTHMCGARMPAAERTHSPGISLPPTSAGSAVGARSLKYASK